MRSTAGEPTRRTAEDGNRPFELAKLAGCAQPDSVTSAGADWLIVVASHADEAVERIEGGEDRDWVEWDTADSSIPSSRAGLWAVFIDLAAYTEDVRGPFDDLVEGAVEALRQIATRLINALLNRDGKVETVEWHHYLLRACAMSIEQGRPI